MTQEVLADSEGFYLRPTGVLDPSYGVSSLSLEQAFPQSRVGEGLSEAKRLALAGVPAVRCPKSC